MAAKARIFSIVGLDTRFLGAQLGAAVAAAPVSVENNRALTDLSRKIVLNIMKRIKLSDLQGHELNKKNIWHRLFKYS